MIRSSGRRDFDDRASIGLASGLANGDGEPPTARTSAMGEALAARAAACPCAAIFSSWCSPSAAGRRVRRRAVLALCRFGNRPHRSAARKRCARTGARRRSGFAGQDHHPGDAGDRELHGKPRLRAILRSRHARQGPGRGRHLAARAATGNSLPTRACRGERRCRAILIRTTKKPPSTGKPYVSNVVEGVVAGHPIYLISVPISENGEVAYFLHMTADLAATRRPAPLRYRPRTDRRDFGSRQYGPGAHRGIPRADRQARVEKLRRPDQKRRRHLARAKYSRL